MSAVLLLWLGCPPRPSATRVRPCCKQQHAGTSAPSTKNHDVLRSSSPLAYNLRFPRPAKHLLMKRKAARPSNNSVSACSSSQKIACNSVEFGHRAACVWELKCLAYGAGASSVNAVFTAEVGWHTPARHRQRSEPNHVTRQMAGNTRTKHKELRRVFSPAGPHFSRRCESFSQRSDRKSM